MILATMMAIMPLFKQATALIERLNVFGLRLRELHVSIVAKEYEYQRDSLIILVRSLLPHVNQRTLRNCT